MQNKSDKLVELKLYSPHECDFIYVREDGTSYALRQKSGQDRHIIELTSEKSNDK
jgi:hypothetical protein